MKPSEWAKKESFRFEDLTEIVALLRSENGCPWDRVQTHRSLRNNLIEEAYEAAEGIDEENDALLREELGDVLLQIVFHAGIAKDRGAFDLDLVIDGVCRKMILRHPHIFSEEKEIRSWEEIKRKEKGEETLSDSLSRVASSLPALKRAEKFVKKGAPDASPEEEKANPLGSALYALCRRAVEEGTDPEEALQAYLKCLLQKCTNCE